jgi:DNA-binding NarL/FixJ family response regulator
MQIAFVEDQEIIRRIITKMVESKHQIIFSASTAEALIRFLNANPAHRHPELVLMDISLDGMNGIEATGLLKKINPKIKIIMLTSFDDDEMVFEAIQNGADGYCIKDEMAIKLLGCIEDVGSGGSYMSPGVARKAMNYLQKTYIPEKLKENNPLSQREIEVLRMAINGEPANQIAAGLHVSLATVKSHFYNIYQKLHVKNKMEAANLVRSKGWV